MLFETPEQSNKDCKEQNLLRAERKNEYLLLKSLIVFNYIGSLLFNYIREL